MTFAAAPQRPQDIAKTVTGVLEAVTGPHPGHPLVARVAHAVATSTETPNPDISLRLTVSDDQPAHETAWHVATALLAHAPADATIHIRIARIATNPTFDETVPGGDWE